MPSGGEGGHELPTPRRTSSGPAELLASDGGDGDDETRLVLSDGSIVSSKSIEKVCFSLTIGSCFQNHNELITLL